MTTLNKHSRYQGKLEDLARRFPAFNNLESLHPDTSEVMPWRFATNDSAKHECSLHWSSAHGYRWCAHVQSLYSDSPDYQTETYYFYSALVLFLGKTGYGKSSTLNAFHGQSIFSTSAVEACTRECQSLDYRLHSNTYLTLADLPGIGESDLRDKEYLALYQAFLTESMASVYVLRADSRDYSVDEQAITQLFPSEQERLKLVIALNCCDKIEPVNRLHSPTPSPEQMQNIARKIETIEGIFQPAHAVIPYSAATGWNMNTLADGIVKAMCQSGRHLLTAAKCGN